jgi:SMODS and SLOG-associating 2TM effector domain 1
MLGLGGLGTFLAAIGLELWIAVTTALAGAFTAYLEAMQLETSLMLYNQAATDLAAIKTWWLALPPNEQFRQATVDRLVTRAEQIMQAELSGWVQEMQDAMTQLRLEQQAERTDGDQPPARSRPTQPGTRPADRAERDATQTPPLGGKQPPRSRPDRNDRTTTA